MTELSPLKMYQFSSVANVMINTTVPDDMANIVEPNQMPVHGLSDQGLIYL